MGGVRDWALVAVVVVTLLLSPPSASSFVDPCADGACAPPDPCADGSCAPPDVIVPPPPEVVVEPPPVDVVPGPVVVCVPAASCAALGCGKTDSCGTFCGACPVVVPPAPVPPPAQAPVSVQVAVQSAAKPLQAVALKFPLQALFMRSISFPDSDCVRPGESALLAVKVRNTGKSTLKGVSFTATVPEAGVRARSGPHTITTNDKLTRFLRLDVPDDAREGSYYLRLTVTSTKFSRTVYRAFSVGSSC